jgi:hypothetical protein
MSSAIVASVSCSTAASYLRTHQSSFITRASMVESIVAVGERARAHVQS